MSNDYSEINLNYLSEKLITVTRSIYISVPSSYIVMNKLKKISLIFIFITLTIAIFALVTLNTIFIIGGISSFVMAVFYLYLNRARRSFRKDLLDTLK